MKRIVGGGHNITETYLPPPKRRNILQMERIQIL
jgi:hypothetical protein